MAKVAVLVGQDFQDSELRIPVDRLRGAGHDVVIVGQTKGELLRGKLGEEETRVDYALSEVTQRDFDALVVPGGGSPGHLRKDARAVTFVKMFVASGKPVAAICHGPELLVEAGVVKGKQMTSWPKVRAELEEAGARWVDQEVVQDGMLITSRKPEDLEAFSRALLEKVSPATAGRPAMRGVGKA